MSTERINIVVTERGSRIVKRRLAGIGTTAGASAGGVNLLKTALLGIGGALVLRQTVRTIANFEQALSTVQAVSGATGDELKSLTARARELGATTRYTATQAGDALVQLSRAGFEVSESLEAVGNTLYLAQAGALDLKRAAELTAGAIRAFRMDASEAGRVADVYALAANSAATDVNQLGDAMKFVAPAAAGLNMTIEKSVGALMALADAQLKGTMGGTGLRQVLIELEAPSSRSRKIMEGLGVAVGDVRISSVGLSTALQVLQEAGISTGQAFRMFGRRGGGAANILLNSVPKINENTKAVEDAGGTAREVARIMDDNLNGALLRVKSAFEAVQLSFGESGGSLLLVASLDHIANALRFLADNIEIVQGAITALTIMALPKLLAALLAVAPAFALLAAGAAIGALVAFRDEIEISKGSIVTLGDFATATWERIREGASIMLTTLRSTLPGLSDAWTGMFGDLDLSIKGFIIGTARLLDNFIGLFVGVVNVIKAIWKTLGPALEAISISLLNGIIDVFELGLKKIMAGMDAIADKIPGIGKLFGDLGDLEIIPRLENTAKDALGGMGEAIAKGFEEGGGTSVFEDSMNDIFDRAEQVARNRIADMAVEVFNAQKQEAGPTTSAAGAAPTPQGPSPALLGTLSLLGEETDLLRLSNSEREIANNLKKVENKLAEQAAVLGAGELAQIENELRHLQLIMQVSQALDQVRGSEVNLAAAQAELNEQVANGNITLAQAKQAYVLLQNEVNATATTIGAGFSRGLNEIGSTITDFASQTEKTLVNAFNSAEDALVSFVTTGQVDFKSMVDSILGDLTRLVARILLVKAIEGMTGSPISALFGGGAAGGGPVEPGKFYMTGEKGPELFSPSVPGQIVPNSQIKKAIGPGEGGEGGGEGNVTIINVSSREEALAAIGSSEGERLIVNVMGKTKREMN